MEDDIQEQYDLWRDKSQIILDGSVDSVREQAFEEGYRRGHRFGRFGGLVIGMCLAFSMATTINQGFRLYEIRERNRNEIQRLEERTQKFREEVKSLKDFAYSSH